VGIVRLLAAGLAVPVTAKIRLLGAAALQALGCPSPHRSQ
jgi:hypothetical protein